MKGLRIVLAATVGAFAVTAGLTYGYLYWKRSRAKVKHSLPGIWQHPSAEPGAWDQTLVASQDPKSRPGRYISAVFHGGSDYVMDQGKTMDACTLNQVIDDRLAQGYERLDFETYKTSYGMQNLP
jgi:hypothetical protein